MSEHITDAQFTVVSVKGRPKWAANWSQAQFDRWKKLPIWKQYKWRFNWESALLCGAIASGPLVRDLMHYLHQ